MAANGNNMNDNSKPVVVITGCSAPGIGFETAKEFARLGKYRVFATARTLSKLDALPANVHRVALDVTNKQGIKTAIETITKETGGRIDILVNNAGTNLAIGPLVEVDLDRVKATFDANVFGLLAVTQAVSPYMIKARKGTIVNVGSTAGYFPMPYGGAYSSSKAAVHALSDVLRAELKGFGISVVVVAPGAIKSLIGEAGASTISMKPNSKYENVKDMIIYRAQYSQTGSPTPTDEFARMLVKGVTARHPVAYLTAGARSFGAWLMYYMPPRIRDYVAALMFKTNRIGRA